jgi:hypothetical protein
LETMSSPFVEGIDYFVNAAKVYVTNNVQSKGYTNFPCVDYKNENVYKCVEQIRFRLIRRGFIKNYKVWNMHGE